MNVSTKQRQFMDVGNVFLLCFLCLGVVGCTESENLSDKGKGNVGNPSAENRFAVRWFQQCMRERGDENGVCSPLGAWFLTGSLSLGSDGSTREELRKLLGEELSPEEWQSRLQPLEKWKRENDWCGMTYRIWVQKGFPLRKDYAERVKNTFGAEIREVDLTQKENWKEIETVAGKFPSETSLRMENTWKFPGKWKYAWDTNETRNGYFADLQGEFIRLPMMQQTGFFRYYQGEDFQWLEIPYAGEAFSMVLFLPESHERFSEFEERFSATIWEECLARAEEKEVEIRLPTFSMTCLWDIAAGLKGMGVRDSLSTTADFGPISDSWQGMGLQIFQKVIWNVDERGEEISLRAMDGKIASSANVPVTFYADRPFLFFVMGKEKKQILLAGRLVRPENIGMAEKDSGELTSQESPSENAQDDAGENLFHTQGIGGSIE